MRKHFRIGLILVLLVGLVPGIASAVVYPGSSSLDVYGTTQPSGGQPFNLTRLPDTGTPGGVVLGSVLHAATGDIDSLAQGAPFDHIYQLTMFESHDVHVGGTFSGFSFGLPGAPEHISVGLDMDGSSGFEMTWSGSGGLLSTDAFAVEAGDIINIQVSGFVVGDPAEYNFEVYAAPIPAAAWLFGSALVGFVVVSRRRKT